MTHKYTVQASRHNSPRARKCEGAVSLAVFHDYEHDGHGHVAVSEDTSGQVCSLVGHRVAGIFLFVHKFWPHQSSYGFSLAVQLLSALRLMV